MTLRRYRQDTHAGVRLLCLPHAGGNAVTYRPWALALPPEVDVVAVQYPGRWDRIDEPSQDSVVGLAQEVARAVRADGRGPVALFGHSLGAIVAYEAARVLEDDLPLVRLIVSARSAPHRGRATAWHLASDDDLWRQVQDLGGTDPDVLEHEELRKLVIPALRLDYRLAETYTPTPGPPLRCGVTALVGDRDPHVTVAEAGAWRDVTAGDFELVVFPGGHFYLNSEGSAVVDRLLRAVVRR